LGINVGETVGSLLTMRCGECLWRWLFAAQLGGLLFTVLLPAEATPLRWNAPADCARSESVAARVEELSGRSLATLDDPSFEVNVVHDGDAWHLTLVTRTAAATSRRELGGRSCDEVTGAAAVAMAMAIRATAPQPVDSEPAAASTPASPEPPPAPIAASPATAPAAATAPPQNGEKTTRVAGIAGIAALLDTAALPGPTAGVGLSAGLRFASLHAELQGEAFASRTATLDAGRSGKFGLLAAALLGCVDPPRRGLALLGCAGIELGRLSGEGSGVSNPELGSVLWFAARLEVGAGVEVSPGLRLLARFGVAVPFERREFVLDGEPVHQPAALSLRAALGGDFSW
jgi:hypothetical protein